MQDFFHMETVLENERVLLRPLQYYDFEHLVPYSREEPGLWKYSLVRPDSETNLRNYIRIAQDAAATGSELPFMVYDKQSRQYAGSTRYYDINREYRTVQVGYTWYGSRFWGSGLNKNCKYLMLSHAFETAGMERVEFRADANNERSIAAMRSIGCKVDGILRSNMPTSGSELRRDSIVLSILKDEWFSEVKNKLELRLNDN